MKRKISKEQKQTYFKRLRQEWQQAKETAKLDEIGAIIQNHGLNISPIGFALVARQMQELNLEGIPYLDAKTYQGWKENGFQVQKGETSRIHGITWINVNKHIEIDDPENEDESFLMPKVYNLFHKTQVQPL